MHIAHHVGARRMGAVSATHLCVTRTPSMSRKRIFIPPGLCSPPRPRVSTPWMSAGLQVVHTCVLGGREVH